MLKNLPRLKLCMCPTAQITEVFHFPAALPLRFLYVQIVLVLLLFTFPFCFPPLVILYAEVQMVHRHTGENKEGFFLIFLFSRLLALGCRMVLFFLLSCFAADIVVFVTKMHRPAPALTNKSAFHGWLNLIESSTPTKGTKGINLFH